MLWNGTFPPMKTRPFSKVGIMFYSHAKWIHAFYSFDDPSERLDISPNGRNFHCELNVCHFSFELKCFWLAANNHQHKWLQSIFTFKHWEWILTAKQPRIPYKQTKPNSHFKHQSQDSYWFSSIEIRFQHFTRLNCYIKFSTMFWK